MNAKAGSGLRPVRIQVDRNVCVGSGSCVMSDPAVFDQDGDGVVVLIDPQPDAAHEVAVRAAAIRCPSGAIRLEATRTEQ